MQFNRYHILLLPNPDIRHLLMCPATSQTVSCPDNKISVSDFYVGFGTGQGCDNSTQYHTGDCVKRYSIRNVHWDAALKERCNSNEECDIADLSVVAQTCNSSRYDTHDYFLVLYTCETGIS